MIIKVITYHHYKDHHHIVSFVILNKEIIQKDKVSLVYKHIGSHDIRSTNHAVSLHIEFL